MQVFCVLVLLFFGVKAFEKDNVVKIPLEHHVVSKEVLMAKQNIRLKKLGITKGSLPKYHQKLIENPNIRDYFTTNISLGSPAQNFNVMLSSGGARLWVLDKEYPSKSKNQSAYNPTKSSTSKALNKDFFQTDGPFKSYEKFYSDNFQMGQFKVQGQAFGSIQKIEDPNNFVYPIDGVLGFDHLIPSIYKNGSEPTAPSDNIFKNIKKEVTVYMKPLLDPNNQEPYGQFSIGGFDNYYCNVSSLMYSFQLLESTILNRFALDVTDVYFNSGSIAENSNGLLHFDSSYSNIVFPAKELSYIYDNIQPDYNWDLGLYTLPCSRAKDITNNLEIYINYEGVSIPEESLVADFNLGNDTCVFTIEMNDGTYSREFILGISFARQYCIYHDYELDMVLLYSHLN